jgi:hypothetical protein
LPLKIEPPTEEFEGDDAAALAFVISKNIHRRHLKAKEKREAIAALLKADPKKSDRQVAEMSKVSPTFVGKVRAEKEATGDVSTMDTRTDTKGRKQPAKRKKRPTVEDFKRDVAAKKAVAAPAPPAKTARDSIAPDEQLALLREFAAFVINRAKSVSVDPKDHDEWKTLRSRVKATLGDHLP